VPTYFAPVASQTRIRTCPRSRSYPRAQTARYGRWRSGRGISSRGIQNVVLGSADLSAGALRGLLAWLPDRRVRPEPGSGLAGELVSKLGLRAMDSVSSFRHRLCLGWSATPYLHGSWSVWKSVRSTWRRLYRGECLRDSVVDHRSR